MDDLCRASMSTMRDATFLRALVGILEAVCAQHASAAVEEAVGLVDTDEGDGDDEVIHEVARGGERLVVRG